jgi:phosphatidylglycerophosphate synthase
VGDAEGTAEDDGWGGRVKARDEVLDMLASGMRRVGIRPNHLTLMQVPVYFFMVRAGIQHDLYLFGVLQLLVMALDGLDGTLARRMGIQSRAGAYLDAAFDLFGIVLVMLVAIHVQPHYSVLLMLVLVLNLLLYFQNYLLDEKAVSYVRGPIVVGIVAEGYWPGILLFAIWIPLIVTAVLLLVRVMRKPRALPGPVGPPPYRPGFSAPPRRKR